MSQASGSIPTGAQTRPRLVFLAIVAVAAMAVGIGFALLRPGRGPRLALPTSFQYTAEELRPLAAISTKTEITTAELAEWDEKTFWLVSKNSLVTGFDPDTSRILAYLITAQRDAAHISFNVKGKFAGSIAQVSREVLCVFFRSDCAALSPSEPPDRYSQLLAEIVMQKVIVRMAEDQSRAAPYPAQIGPQYWSGVHPIGIRDGSRKPWLIQSGSQFRVPPPPANQSTEFKRQLLMTKEARQSITRRQRDAVIFWAGGPGTKTPPGIWLNLANEFMGGLRLPLDQVLSVRAALAMAIADANIAVFDSKYTYWVKRPFMMDRSIITVMPTPNHPSFPAGHSTISAAAATVLGYFFPNDKSYWIASAQEAGNSRVWAGIHYPMDNEQGWLLGVRVGTAALARFAAAGSPTMKTDR